MRFAPVAEIILEVRKLDKVDRLPLQSIRSDGRCHPQFFYLVLPKKRMKELDMQFQVRRIMLEESANVLFSFGDASRVYRVRYLGLRIERFAYKFIG